jgi:hypothetical protein
MILFFEPLFNHRTPTFFLFCHSLLDMGDVFVPNVVFSMRVIKRQSVFASKGSITIYAKRMGRVFVISLSILL